MQRIALVLAALALSLPAAALTLKEKKQFKEWNDWLQDPAKSYLGSVKEKCGYEIPVSLDEAVTTPFMAENTSASSYCDAALSTLAELCGDDLGKKSVKAKIKKVSCKLGKKEEATFKIANGDLQFTFGVNASNLGDKAKKFLEDNL